MVALTTVDHDIADRAVYLSGSGTIRKSQENQQMTNAMKSRARKILLASTLAILGATGAVGWCPRSAMGQEAKSSAQAKGKPTQGVLQGPDETPSPVQTAISNGKKVYKLARYRDTDTDTGSLYIIYNNAALETIIKKTHYGPDTGDMTLRDITSKGELETVDRDTWRVVDSFNINNHAPHDAEPYHKNDYHKMLYIWTINTDGSLLETCTIDFRTGTLVAYTVTSNLITMEPDHYTWEMKHSVEDQTRILDDPVFRPDKHKITISSGVLITLSKVAPPPGTAKPGKPAHPKSQWHKPRPSNL